MDNTVVKASIDIAFLLVLSFPALFTFFRWQGSNWNDNVTKKQKIIAYVEIFSALIAVVLYSDDPKVLVFAAVLVVMNILDVICQLIVSEEW